MMNDVNYTEKMNLNDLVAIAWRRKFTFLSVFIPILLTAFYFAVSIPAEYRSSATLLVEAQEIPDDTVRSSIGGYVEAHLAAIEKRILASTVLKQVMMESGVSEDRITNEFLVDVRERIGREATIIESPTPRGASSTISFTVSYISRNPVIAYEVTQRLATLYTQENSKLRIGLAESTNKFLQDEANRLKSDLKVIENQIAKFKAENLDALPENLANNLSSIDKTELSLQLLDDEINQLQSQTFEIQQQLLTTEEAEGIDVLKDEISKKKLQLSQARLQFTEAHPDIQALKESISELEKVVASDDENLTSKKNRRNHSISEASTTDANLVIMLKSRLSQVNNNLQHLQQKREKLQQKKIEYETRLSASPAVEQEFMELQRELTNTKEALDKLKSKQMSARLSLQLEKDEKAERFALIEPASLPQEPYKPNRPALGFLGFVLAFGLGVISVALTERYSLTVNGIKALTNIMGEPPLAAIPVISKM